MRTVSTVTRLTMTRCSPTLLPKNPSKQSVQLSLATFTSRPRTDSVKFQGRKNRTKSASPATYHGLYYTYVRRNREHCHGLYSTYVRRNREHCHGFCSTYVRRNREHCLCTFAKPPRAGSNLLSRTHEHQHVEARSLKLPAGSPPPRHRVLNLGSPEEMNQPRLVQQRQQQRPVAETERERERESTETK